MKKFNSSMYKKELAEKAQAHYTKMNLFYSRITENCVNNSVINTLPDPKFLIKEPRHQGMEIQLLPTDTASAIFMCSADAGSGRICALNFSSFKHPGGMFLNGSTAQEEALCHESNLYNILLNFESTYYAENKRFYTNRSLYLDRSIYTPGVLFIRGDVSTYCDIITCAAPNKRSAMKYNGVFDYEVINALNDRIYHVLNVAYMNKVDTLILGAYGCGVFGNDPYEVALIFKSFLNDTFKNCFKNVIFAIPAGTNYETFVTVFKQHI